MQTTPPKDKSLDDLHKQLQGSQLRVNEANEFIGQLGDWAKKIGISIDGATLELNATLKQLFICAISEMPEYELIFPRLVEHVQGIMQLAQTKFGRLKQPEKH